MNRRRKKNRMIMITSKRVMAMTARLEAEEQSAIGDGMKALNLFFDPKCHNNKLLSGNISDSGEGDTMIVDAEEDIW